MHNAYEYMDTPRIHKNKNKKKNANVLIDLIINDTLLNTRLQINNYPLFSHHQVPC